MRRAASSAHQQRVDAAGSPETSVPRGPLIAAIGDLRAERRQIRRQLAGAQLDGRHRAAAPSRATARARRATAAAASSSESAPATQRRGDLALAVADDGVRLDARASATARRARP